MRFISREERQQLLDAEAERQRAHADLWHVNMDDAAVARFLKQRRFDPTIPPDRPAEDLARARDLAALAALAQRAPGFGASRSLLEFCHIAVVPVGANLQATGTPMTSVVEAFAWYSDHPADGVAVIAVPGILALQIDRWSSWQAWLRRFDRTVRVPMDVDRPDERWYERQEPAPCGTPCTLQWWPPARPEQPHDPIPYRGDKEGLEIWAKMTAPYRAADRGGFLAWACPADLRFTSRNLAPGLSVLATGNLLPYHVTRSDGMTLHRVSGTFTDSDPLRSAPGWLLDEVRANVITRTVKAVRGRSPKKKPAAKARGDYDVLDSVPEPTRRPAESWRAYPPED